MQSTITSAKEELAFIKQQCVDLVDKLDLMKSVVPAAHIETFRLLSVPLLYSAWERLFSIGHSLCLRVVRIRYACAGDCPPSSRALWLRKADFFKGFVVLQPHSFGPPFRF